VTVADVLEFHSIQPLDTATLAGTGPYDEPLEHLGPSTARVVEAAHRAIDLTLR